jgi:shikimate dehydrogenase
MVLPRFHVGLIGAGIGRSLSPAMHMREGQEQGFGYQYDIIDIEALGLSVADLPKLIEQAQDRGFAGLNITHPCKQAAVALVDELSEDAKILQAINTIVFSGAKRFGHNTDWWGFSESFKRGLPKAGMNRIVQLGAGGAGVAIAHAMASMGAANIAVFDVDRNRAEALARQLQPFHPGTRFSIGSDLPSGMAAADGLAHATPTGMGDHPGLPLDIALLRPDMWVAEIVYFPIETELVKEARKIGCQVLDGGGMAVFQAVKAFELFTDAAPDAGRMLAHFQTIRA